MGEDGRCRPALEPPWHHPAVRDLAALLFSPDLFDASHFPGLIAAPFDAHDFGAQARARASALLDALDEDPAVLVQALAGAPVQRATYLGIYAERLLAFYLSRLPDTRLQAVNLAVRRDGRTLGECDFLIMTASGARLHWELATKFYLCLPEPDAARPPPLERYLGPGLTDRLDLKLARLLRHQLGLTRHPAFDSALHGSGWRPGMLVKGRLFYPLTDTLGPSFTRQSLPLAACDERLAGDHPRGWWATLDAWKAAGPERWQWRIAERLEWLRAASMMEAQGFQDSAAFAVEVERRHAERAMPVMVVARARTDLLPGGGPSDLLPGFIVDANWPERAAQWLASAHHQ